MCKCNSIHVARIVMFKLLMQTLIVQLLIDLRETSIVMGIEHEVSHVCISFLSNELILGFDF